MILVGDSGSSELKCHNKIIRTPMVYHIVSKVKNKCLCGSTVTKTFKAKLLERKFTTVRHCMGTFICYEYFLVKKLFSPRLYTVIMNA